MVDQCVVLFTEGMIAAAFARAEKEVPEGIEGGDVLSDVAFVEELPSGWRFKLGRVHYRLSRGSARLWRRWRRFFRRG